MIDYPLAFRYSNSIFIFSLQLILLKCPMHIIRAFIVIKILLTPHLTLTCLCGNGDGEY